MYLTALSNTHLPWLTICVRYWYLQHAAMWHSAMHAWSIGAYTYGAYMYMVYQVAPFRTLPMSDIKSPILSPWRPNRKTSPLRNNKAGGQARVAIFVAPPSSEVGSQNQSSKDKFRLDLPQIEEASNTSHMITQVGLSGLEKHTIQHFSFTLLIWH